MSNHSAAPDPLFLALGDPTRLMVVRRLCERPHTVSELHAPLDMALPTFLHHLKVLERSGWTTSAKRGRVRTCSLQPAALAAAGGWLDAQRKVWNNRFDRLDSLVLSLHAAEPTHD